MAPAYISASLPDSSDPFQPARPSICKARIVIFTALFPEAAAIARRLGLPTHFHQNLVQRGEIAIALIGPGARFLPDIAPRLEAQAFLMAGLAGGLDPRLRVADIVLDGVIPPNFRSEADVRMFPGKLFTSPILIASPAKKAALFAQSSALAVDMETDHVRTLAQARGIPFLALRAISDTAADALDPATLKLIDPLGRPRPFRAAGHVALHPGQLPTLLRLAKNTRSALSHLARAIDALLASNWPTA